MIDVFNTLWQIVGLVGTLALELLTLLSHFLLPIVWIAWWLFAVNWKKLWPVLKHGAWAPLVLLMAVGALVWSRLAPADYYLMNLVSLPNFWWQLEFVALLVAVALLCGWLQGVFKWSISEVDVAPPAHAHDAGHGHAH